MIKLPVCQIHVYSRRRDIDKEHKFGSSFIFPVKGEVGQLSLFLISSMTPMTVLTMAMIFSYLRTMY